MVKAVLQPVLQQLRHFIIALVETALDRALNIYPQGGLYRVWVYIEQHAIFADLVPFSLTLGCSKYELRY